MAVEKMSEGKVSEPLVSPQLGARREMRSRARASTQQTWKQEIHLLILVGLMFVCPVLSITVELLGFGGGASPADVIARWFVFWGVGVRLFTAGVRQVFQPRYTARIVLGLKHQESLLVIRELGFANTAIGTVGVVSIFVSRWTLAAAVAGAVFYGLAGANHIRQLKRSRSENIAMTTDSLFAVLLLVLSLMLAL